MEEKKKIKVMIVDDSVFFCRAIKADLEKYTDINVCLLAHNGLSAIQMLQSFIPDVVILDLEMGEVSGFEVMQQIKQVHEVPFIVLSGITADKPELKQKALDLGAFQVIEKPVDKPFDFILPNFVKCIRACVSDQAVYSIKSNH